MGLDNGVLLRVKNSDLNYKLARFKMDSYEENVYDMFYWRKWYGLRVNIIKVLEYCGANYDKDKCLILFDLTGLELLFFLLKITYGSRKAWEDSDNIWDYEECRAEKRFELKKARKVAKVLKKYKCGEDYTLEFYDSY